VCSIFSVLFVKQIDSNLGDIQYLFIDLILILAFAFVSKLVVLICLCVCHVLDAHIQLPLIVCIWFTKIYEALTLCVLYCVVGFSGPYPRLIKRRPPGTLAGLAVLLSLLVHIMLITVTQLALWFYLKQQHWLVYSSLCNFLYVKLC